MKVLLDVYINVFGPQKHIGKVSDQDSVRLIFFKGLFVKLVKQTTHNIDEPNILAIILLITFFNILAKQYNTKIVLTAISQNLIKLKFEIQVKFAFLFAIDSVCKIPLVSGV